MTGDGVDDAFDPDASGDARVALDDPADTLVDPDPLDPEEPELAAVLVEWWLRSRAGSWPEASSAKMPIQAAANTAAAPLATRPRTLRSRASRPVTGA